MRWLVLLSLAAMAWGQNPLDGVLQVADLEYYPVVLTGNYSVVEEFDQRAMGHLYAASKHIIDAIVSKQAYPEGIVVVEDTHVQLNDLSEHKAALLKHYAGPIAFLVLALLLTVILPFSALIWCMCRVCRSSRRRRPFDRKNDACLKGLLALTLIAVLTLFLFGVVCAFATEEQLAAGVASAPANARRSIRDARVFLNDTQAHVHWLLVTNYRQLNDHLDKILAGGEVAIPVQLRDLSRASSLLALTSMVGGLQAAQRDLQTVQNLTNRLRVDAESLNAGLRSVKSELLHILKECNLAKCQNIKARYGVEQLETQIQYDQIPDVSGAVSSVSAFVASDVGRRVQSAQAAFKGLQADVRQAITDHVPAVQAQLKAAGQELEWYANNVTAQTSEASEALQRIQADMDQLRDAHGDSVLLAQRAVELVPAAALLAITLALVLGLLCGICGKRPDVYGADDCCDKGSGASALLCGLGLILVLGGVVALLLAINFALGVTTLRVICDPLSNQTAENRVWADMEKFVDFEDMMFGKHQDPEYTLATVLQRCHANHSLFQTLELERRIDLEALKAKVLDTVTGATSELQQRSLSLPRVRFLDQQATQQLQALADSGLSDLRYDTILQALETNLTTLPLLELGRKLRETALELARKEPVLGQRLQQAAELLQTTHTQRVLPMADVARQLNETALRLRQSLSQNHASLKDAVTFWLRETKQAEDYLNSQGGDLVRNLTGSFAESLRAAVTEYLDLVTKAAKEDVGRCGPMSHVFNATRDDLCLRVLTPLNGFWISLWWCVLLLLPLAVLASKLSALYTHLEPYPGPLVEAEYLYDAYADRDNVPLANAYKAEKRTRREPRGAGAGPGAGAAPEAPGAPAPVDAHHARRYHDMAPKHWEDGPPRYGRPEYERPPPYYYPGPAE